MGNPLATVGERKFAYFFTLIVILFKNLASIVLMSSNPCNVEDFQSTCFNARKTYSGKPGLAAANVIFAFIKEQSGQRA